MVTQVDEKEKTQKKYRRLSDNEMGLTPGPKFEEKDKQILQSLKSSFPYRAERAHRDGGGERIIPRSIYDGREQNIKRRQDRFDPKYGPCPAPVRDDNGNYTERCCWQVGKPTDADIKAYEARFDAIPPKEQKGSIWNCSITQFMVRRHHLKEHWDWWITEFGRVDKHGGKEYRRPPMIDDVIFPDWSLEE